MNLVYSLEGKTILVTGASSGIGKGVAIKCAEAGGRMIITGRDNDRLSEVCDSLVGNENMQLICDLSKEELIIDFVKQLPLLDGVVLCAGMVKTLPVKYNSFAKTEEIFMINVFSNITLIKHLFNEGKINKGASIVFISSLASIKPYKGNSLYSATKGAINSFARVMALEYGNKGIRVNSILPGIIRTKPVSNFSEEEMSKVESSIPLGFGRTDDVAYGCVYLLSDAGKWITGIELIIDGGQSIS